LVPAFVAMGADLVIVSARAPADTRVTVDGLGSQMDVAIGTIQRP
jgi:hypothetical protein